jgi:hypothetical protein
MVDKTFDFQCCYERNNFRDFIVTSIPYSTGNMWMQNYCSRLIAGGGNVGCAKYAGEGGKGENISVVTKEDQIC